MRWIVTGAALAAVVLAGVNVARACGGCCKGGGGGCPTCPHSGSPSGPARPAAPAACPSCPQPDTASWAYRYPVGATGSYSYPARATAGPTADGRDRRAVNLPPTPTTAHSTSYLGAPAPVQTTSRYERPVR